MRRSLLLPVSRECLLVSNVCRSSPAHWTMQKEQIIKDTYLDWIPAVGDNALVVAVVDGVVDQLPARRGNWHCQDWSRCLELMSTNAGSMMHAKTASECNDFFTCAQAALQDNRSCAQRRRDRIPEHIRAVLQQIPATHVESERKALRQLTNNLFRAHRKEAE